MSDAFMKRYGYVNPKKLPKFTYTGASVATTDANGWMILLKTSGTLTFGTKLPKGIDVFLVGGGGGGSACLAGGWLGEAAGGAGGYTTTAKGIEAKKSTEYTITIGAGGAGGTNSSVAGKDGEKTTAFGKTANGGTARGSAYVDNAWRVTGGNGGSGGGSPSNYGGTYQGAGGSNGGDGGASGIDREDGEIVRVPGGKGQGSTTRAFGESTGWLFAAGGGCGGHYPRYDTSQTAGGTGENITVLGINTKGGDGGVLKGSGGPYVGGSAAANSGSGGGGGGARYTPPGAEGGNIAFNGGNGGSGIVIIRNAR